MVESDVYGLHALGRFAADLFKSRCRLEAENLLLRHQFTIASRQAKPRLRLRGSDRALLVWIIRFWPSLLGAVQVVQPEPVLRWHCASFPAFWRWKSRKKAGQPKIDRGLRDLIRRMSRENQLWGVSRIHGELLMLGFEVASIDGVGIHGPPFEAAKRRRLHETSHTRVVAPRFVAKVLHGLLQIFAPLTGQSSRRAVSLAHLLFSLR